jgi:tetratricopeptide (TPR) repeat protein
VSLGYANLQEHRPKEALAAFNAAASSLPARYDLMVDNNVLANIAHGRARSLYYLGDLRHAIGFEEEAARLLPDANVWLQLASLYDLAGRTADANRVRAQVMSHAEGR